MDGHVVLGFGFMIIGLWHLFNHIKLHALNTTITNNNFWFPTPKFKYLELIFIITSSTIFIALELFISPSHHHPFDPLDGTIPTTHLHNFEHASMSLSFFIYASFAIALDVDVDDDVTASKARSDLTLLLAAIAFAQQLLLIHFHSADHVGPEGQYHWLAQILVLVSLATTLVGIVLRDYSFFVCFVRSVSILFQGVWLMVIGFVLWTPALIPKGCFMDDEEGRHVVRCVGQKALRRAVSIVNVQFSWFFIGVAVFAASFYLVLVNWYGGEKKKTKMKMKKKKEEYYGCGEGDVMKDDDVESQRKSIQLVGNIVTDDFVD